jgi:DNA topoisomerase III
MNRKKPVRKIPNPSDFKAAFAAVHIAIRNRLEGTLISILVVAEKPSVAMSYAKVLGATNRKDGYLEGNGYLVSWCVGHLVELAPPNVYDAKYVKWSIADLPILPQKWQYLVSASTQKQFGILQKLMHRPDVDSIVNSCDSGREGELIFRLVYQQAGCKKPFSRLWLSSMEENAIREGFAHLKPSTEYDTLYNAALCRERADWMVGINASRLFSCLYNQPLAVGRVMTPVLAMTVVREAAIAAFVPEKFYTVALTLADGGTASSKRFAQKADAELLLSKCRKEGRVTVQKMERKEKSESPPQLYDLTALQRDANRLLGFTAQQTLDYAQSLYEKRLITYPRTDSRFLTEDMAASLPGLVTATGKAFAVEEPLPIHVQQVINGNKVTDHHALLPTKSMAKADLAALPAGERNVLRLIAARLLCAVGEPHRYAETTIITICAGEEFSAKGKVVLSEGWKTMERKMLGELLGKQKEPAVLPDVQEQSQCSVAGAELKEGQTSPPKSYTEDTLLSAMQAAGADSMPEGVERQGIGTPATRAATIEKLVQKGFLERKGSKKTKVLLPTDKGKALITVMPEEIQSPEMTADWETKLLKIERSEMEPETFMTEIKEMISSLVTTTEAAKGANALMKNKIIGVCPNCGKPVVEREKGWFCENRECRFVLWKDNAFLKRLGKRMDAHVADKLLRDGRVRLKDCKSAKGKTYNATVLLSCEADGRSKFSLEFEGGC